LPVISILSVGGTFRSWMKSAQRQILRLLTRTKRKSNIKLW